MNKMEATLQSALHLVRQRFDSSTATYGQFSSIYIAPTGNVKDTMAPFRNAKRVLSVGGMGAFGFEGALNGATVVDFFDCNELQRCFFELVRASFITLTYDEFMEYFTLKVQKPMMTREEMKNLLPPILFYKVVDLLPYDVAYLYEMLYSNFDHVDMIYSALYRYEHAIYREFLKRFASIYDEEKYYELQQILRKSTCKMTYRQVSLVDVPDKFEGPYDLIVLGNILQYYEGIPFLNTPYEVDHFIKKKLSKLLAPDGTIVANYGFGLSTSCIKQEFGIDQADGYQLNYLQKMMVQNRIKKDINVNLLKRGGYDYFFVQGVETFEGEDLDNTCLIYRPKETK